MKAVLLSCSTEVGQTLLWLNNNESLNLTSLCTCSRWLLSAYPLTNSQYRVVDRLGPGRSSMLFSFPASVAAWTFSLLPPCRSSGSVRTQSAASRGARAEAAGEPMVRAVRRWMFWCVCVCVCVTVLFVMEPRLRSNAFILKGLTGSVVSLLFLTSHVVMLNCSRLLPPAATQRNYNGLILNKTN